MNRATIVIPCYNAEKSIEKAVQSALDQTMPVDVIVVDDCSTDGSFARLQAMSKDISRLTAIRQNRNSGPAAARNFGLQMVRTPWAAGLDADDYLLPDRMRRLVEHAELNRLDFVADDVIRIEKGQAPEEGFRVWKDEMIGAMPISFAQFVQGSISKYSGLRREIGYLKPLMRVDFLRTHDLYFREDMRLSEDYEFYARSLARGARWEVIDPCGYIAVSTPGSLSYNFPTSALQKVLLHDRELLAHPNLTPEDRKMLREHIYHVSKDYAWRMLIDGGRAHSVTQIAQALTQSPLVAGTVLVRTAKHFLGIPVLPKYSNSGRIRAGKSAKHLFT